MGEWMKADQPQYAKIIRQAEVTMECHREVTIKCHREVTMECHRWSDHQMSSWSDHGMSSMKWPSNVIAEVVVGREDDLEMMTSPMTSRLRILQW